MISPILDINAHVEEPDNNAQSRIFEGVDTRCTLSCQESGISPVVVGQL